MLPEKVSEAEVKQREAEGTGSKIMAEWHCGSGRGTTDGRGRGRVNKAVSEPCTKFAEDDDDDADEDEGEEAVADAAARVHERARAKERR